MRFSVTKAGSAQNADVVLTRAVAARVWLHAIAGQSTSSTPGYLTGLSASVDGAWKLLDSVTKDNRRSLRSDTASADWVSGRGVAYEADETAAGTSRTSPRTPQRSAAGRPRPAGPRRSE
jgi:hypothetical protein